MLNTMIIYINKLAMEARKSCEKENLFPQGAHIISEDQAAKVIKYFGGKIEKNQSQLSSNGYIEKDGDSFIIKYKSFKAIDIFHELGHAFLHLEDIPPDKDGLPLEGQHGVNEGFASVFARAFLMPEDIFCEDVMNLSKNSFCDIQALADLYEVEYSDVIMRGRELNLWE